MSNWRDWYNHLATSSAMATELVALASVDPKWGMQDGGERYGRSDGSFFDLVGIRVTTGGEREVGGWNQPMLREVGNGVVVLAYSQKSKHRFLYLVAARPEPGNRSTGCVLLAPTLQASESNLKQAHGGKRPPHADLADGVPSDAWTVQRMDGGRFYWKVNKYGLIEVESDLPLQPNERWMNRLELRQAMEDGLVNEHLMICLAIDLL